MKKKIVIMKDGPYLVTGGIPLGIEVIVTDRDGYAWKWRKGWKGRKFPLKKSYLLCRCGRSKNPPFCDGAHLKSRFKGPEKPGQARFKDMAKTYRGPALELKDAEKLCAGAGFCTRGKGVWKYTEGSADPVERDLAVQETLNCPAGRLTVSDRKTGKSVEPRLKAAISIVEDPAAGVSGPLWVKGRVAVISSDGTRHEVRNRMTLCRCGRSKNKPFCDDRHYKEGFVDGLK